MTINLGDITNVISGHPVLALSVFIVVTTVLVVVVLLMRKKLHGKLSRLSAMRSKLEADATRLAEQLNEAQLQHTKATSEIEAARDNITDYRARLEALQSQFDTLNQNYRDQTATLSGETQRLQAEKNALQEKLEQINNDRKQMSDEFELLANRIFDEKAQRFTKNSEAQMQNTLAPLKEQLGEFRKRVDQVYTAEAKERHALAEQINRLREESVRISEDANNLTRALRHDNKAQGNWGELTLLSALEMCGLREGIEFDTQLAVTEEGVRSIPDVVVHLPGNKDIIIDSKVSLLAYTRYFEADDDAAQSAALDQHLQSVRAHVKGLSGKNYSSLQGLQTLDYVMLYIPVEGASSLALQNDPELWSFAYSKNIVLVGPSNLLAILRSVETIWRHERQNKNAEKIAAEAGKLHDQFVLFAESLEEVGKQIDRARGAYDKAQERLVSGRGNVLRRVENLEKLGAKTQRKIPEKLLSSADDSPVLSRDDNDNGTRSSKQLEQSIDFVD